MSRCDIAGGSYEDKIFQGLYFLFPADLADFRADIADLFPEIRDRSIGFEIDTIICEISVYSICEIRGKSYFISLQQTAF